MLIPPSCHPSRSFQRELPFFKYWNETRRSNTVLLSSVLEDSIDIGTATVARWRRLAADHAALKSECEAIFRGLASRGVIIKQVLPTKEEKEEALEAEEREPEPEKARTGRQGAQQRSSGGSGARRERGSAAQQPHLDAEGNVRIFIIVATFLGRAGRVQVMCILCFRSSEKWMACDY